MTTTGRLQQRYDHRLRDLVQGTGGDWTAQEQPEELALCAGAFRYSLPLDRTRNERTYGMASTLAPGELFTMESLVTPTAQGIASRVLARTAAGNITLFAFDVGEELSEHTAPFNALALTLSGSLVLTIGGRAVRTAPQTIVLMPANVPHAVHATEASRMLLIMLREAP